MRVLGHSAWGPVKEMGKLYSRDCFTLLKCEDIKEGHGSCGVISWGSVPFLLNG